MILEGNTTTDRKCVWYLQTVLIKMTLVTKSSKNKQTNKQANKHKQTNKQANTNKQTSKQTSKLSRQLQKRG
jgi:hypothetical protein